MKTTDDIEAKIDNLFSAMESGDHKAFAEIISSEDNWNTDEAKDYFSDLEFMRAFLVDANFSSARKKSLLKLMVKHKFDITEPYNFHIITWNPPILKFVLSEFSIPDKSIEEGILYRDPFGWDPLPLKNLKICFEHGYNPTEDGLKTLLFFSAESYDADSAAYLLEKYDINVNQGFGHNPYHIGKTLYLGYSNSSPLTFASHWFAYGVCHTASNKFFKLAKVLLEHGADVNFASHDSGITALMCASHIGIFNFLLRHGADLYAVTKKLKKNMLQRHAGNYACGLPIVKKLVEKYHFDIHYRDASGKTALNYAIGAKNYDVIHYLCKHGALEDVEDIETFVKNTVTNVYSEREKFFVTHLMKYGFDKDDSGRHLFDYCDKAEIEPELLIICIEEESGLDDGFPLTEFSESQISEIEKIIARKVEK